VPGQPTSRQGAKRKSTLNHCAASITRVFRRPSDHAQYVAPLELPADDHRRFRVSNFAQTPPRACLCFEFAKLTIWKPKR
jgi:hypothetical protein